MEQTINKVFFGTGGSCLSSTSANHIANLAKELIKGHQRDLEGMCFTDKTVCALGQEARVVLQKGASEEVLAGVKSKLTEIGEANSLIAWLREGIKAKNAIIAKYVDATFEDFCEWEGIEEEEIPTLEEYLKENGAENSPEAPEKEEVISEKEVIATWNDDDRLEYLTLVNAKNALDMVIENYAEALNTITEAQNKPDRGDFEQDGNMIIHYTSSVEKENVEATLKVFTEKRDHCEQKIRDYRSRINRALAADKSSKEARFVEKEAEYRSAIANYTAVCHEYDNLVVSRQTDRKNDLIADYEAYKVRKAKEAGNLKIVIPASLSEIYAKVANLGKNMV